MCGNNNNNNNKYRSIFNPSEILKLRRGALGDQPALFVFVSNTYTILYYTVNTSDYYT